MIKRHLSAACAVAIAATGASAQPFDFPQLTYNNMGVTTYDAGTDLFAVDATPLAVRFAIGGPIGIVRPTGNPAERFLSIRAIVDENGALVGGVDGDDLIIVGEVDGDGDGIVDFQGVLLSGEITAFSFNVPPPPPGAGAPGGQPGGGAKGSGSVGSAMNAMGINAGQLGGNGAGSLITAIYDFGFTPTGGSLLSRYAGREIALSLTSEMSTFLGDFSLDFTGEAKGTCGPTDAPEGTSCCDEGKPRVLTMRYTGEGCSATSTAQDPDKVNCDGDPDFEPLVFIRATDKEDPDDTGGKTWFEGDVILGDVAVLNAANEGEDNFPSSTYVHIFDQAGALLQTIEFHTSCSQPLRIGDQFGAMRLVGCIGEDTPDPNNCCDEGRPRSLLVRYTGRDCSATSTTQDPDKVNCDGDPGGAPAVFVRASDNEDPDDNGANVWFEGDVMLGEAFDISSLNAGEDKLKSETFVHIFDMQGGTLLQSLEFHTSCSQPLNLGDSFGSLTIVGCTGENTPDPNDCCDAGRPRALEIRYTGDDCSASDNAQDPDKTSCSGDPAFAPTVYIIANNDEDAGDTSRVWFQGEVALGDTYELSALNAGEDDLDSETWIHIFDAQGGTEIQTIEFHTSCSQPVRLGDRFGSAEIVGCTGRDEPVEGDCCADGERPRLLVMIYTGEDCSATSHAQSSDKVACDGDPAFRSPVLVRASNKEDPNDGGAKVWFEGEVALDGTVELDAQRAGETRFESATFVHIFDPADGSLLQSIEFHTSCSQPLFVGNQFGSLLLESCSSELDPDEDSVCADGKPQILTMEYNGDGCVFITSQDPSKVSCTGDPMGMPVVQIVATDQEDPSDDGALVWFDGTVAIGSTFDIDARNGNASRLKSVTWVHIFDVAGNLLQSVEFHTSCSQPLFVDDQYGSLVLRAFVLEP